MSKKAKQIHGQGLGGMGWRGGDKGAQDAALAAAVGAWLRSTHGIPAVTSASGHYQVPVHRLIQKNNCAYGRRAGHRKPVIMVERTRPIVLDHAREANAETTTEPPPWNSIWNAISLHGAWARWLVTAPAGPAAHSWAGTPCRQTR